MNLSSKNLKILAIISVILALSALAYHISEEWKTDTDNSDTGYVIFFTMLGVVFSIATRKKKEKESKGL